MYLSNLVAKQRQAYHKRDDRPENLKLVVDCDDFVKRVFRSLGFEENETLALEGLEYESVVNESDLESEVQQAE